jgi:hypothetical protein
MVLLAARHQGSGEMSSRRPSAIELVTNRFSPFAKDLTTVEKEETHTVPASPSRVQLRETPVEEHPSAVWIPGYREVYTTPTSGYYRVDYTYGTGLIQFHTDNAGDGITVRYRGIGSILSARLYNALIERDPDVWIAGYQHDDWVGTHFGWDPSSPPLTKGWTISQTGSGGYMEHAYSVFSAGRSPVSPSSPYDPETEDQQYSLENRHFGVVANDAGGAVLQARIRNPYADQDSQGALFLCFENVVPPTYDSSGTPISQKWTTQASPFTVDTPNPGDTLIIGYPPWTCLPVGFGWTPGGSKYFCTFERSDEVLQAQGGYWRDAAMILSSWCAVVGAGVLAAGNIPRTQVQTQGGWLTDVSSFFTSGVAQWYEIRIELQLHEARLYVNDRIAAVHNTHIPNTFYYGANWGHHLRTTLTLAYPKHETIAARHDIDYFAAGPLGAPPLAVF